MSRTGLATITRFIFMFSAKCYKNTNENIFFALLDQYGLHRYHYQMQLSSFPIEIELRDFTKP